MEETDLHIVTTCIGDKYIAVMVLGGITLKGGRQPTRADAIRQLLQLLSQPANEEYAMGLELHLENQVLSDLFTPKGELGK